MSHLDMDNQQLCMNLLRSDSEMEVVSILKRSGYWDNSTCWRYFDDNENNYSIIGGQQANPVAALVEKLTNSIDAVLLLQCQLKGVDPKSERAPKSMENALQEYFHVKNGNLALTNSTQRKALSEQIGFIATGEKKKPSYTIFDRGEGQTPNNMPSTFLSLNKSNKLRVPFVQGKYNMGGTGVMRFCGKEQLQLIISKRHPQIADSSDSSSSQWGFTIVRRQEASEGRKSSMYTYLAPERDVLMFDAECLLIPTKNRGSQDIPDLKWGSIIKLYEYGISPAALKTNILFDLYNYISLLTPKIGLPIRFYERRDYQGHSFESTMAGLHVRLEDDRSENIEDDFPSSASFQIAGQKFKASIYVFKKDKAKNYRNDEGIIFTINGQTHGSISTSFFKRGDIGLSYIADSLIVIVECDNISPRTREDLFMNSRDRLSSGELKSAIEEQLTEILKNHPQLKSLCHKRRSEAIARRLADTRPMTEVLEDLLKKSPTLQALFTQGHDIRNPFRPKLVGEQLEFEGKTHPTYFKLMKGHEEGVCHLNQRFRVQFETDVDNDYFIRDRHPGKFEFVLDRVDAEYVSNLHNGILTLTVSLPEGTEEGKTFQGLVCVSDDILIEPFCAEFSRTVMPPISQNNGGKGGRRKPAGQGEGNRQIPDGLSFPSVTEVSEEGWQEKGFDKNSALMVVTSPENTYDFFINVDNVWLKTEQKQKSDSETSLILKTKFINGLVLFGLALLKDKEYLENNNDGQESHSEEYLSVEDLILKTSRSFAPILIPLVDALGELDTDDDLDRQNNVPEPVQRSLFETA